MPNPPRNQIHLKTARTFAHLMDDTFSLFGIKFGLDTILGLIPGVGDVVSMLFSFYLIWIATEMKLPQDKIWQMVRNVILDLIIGSIPLIGDIGDVFLRINIKNLAILETHANFSEKPDNVIEGEVV